MISVFAKSMIERVIVVAFVLKRPQNRIILLMLNILKNKNVRIFIKCKRVENVFNHLDMG